MVYENKYYLFYNARDVEKGHGVWKEYIGIATSSDLKNWKRYENNPILKPGEKKYWDSCFVGDPCVVEPIDSKWYMFYYSYNGKNACDELLFQRIYINGKNTKATLLFHLEKRGTLMKL
ncbi:hypothetical protein J7K25_02325 [bacterium]|nr:hypothetical protein [bacterium]